MKNASSALEQYLSAAEMTQADLGKVLRVSQPTVSDWITGEMYPPVESLIAISRLTRISMDVLVQDFEKARAGVPMLNYVRKRLQANHRRWNEIEADTGLSRRSFEKLIYAPERDPRHSLVAKLFDYFKSAESV